MSRATVRATIAVLALALIAGAAAAAGQSAPSGPQIQRSSSGVAGRTVIAWSAPFAQFQARSDRPADCNRGQKSLVLFVVGASGPNQRTACTARVGQPVMVSPAFVICTPPDRGFCTATERVNDVRRVRMSIDGVPVVRRNFDWVARQGFKLGGEQAAVAGDMYVITGLSAGEHTIVTSVRIRTPEGPFDAGMTATVTVQ